LDDLSEFEVEVLRGSPQDVEGQVGGDALALDKDSLSLPNDFAGG
jgi:hypothetical protein